MHETIKKYWESRSGAGNKLNERERKLLEEITGEGGRNVSYRSTKEELAAQLEEPGRLMYRLLREPGAESQPDYALLKRVFEEQYAAVEGPGGGVKCLRRRRQRRRRMIRMLSFGQRTAGR